MTNRMPPPRTLGPDSELPLQYPLSAHESYDAWYVVVEDHIDDWLVRFEKAPGFDAREWATSMAQTFNTRLRAQIGYGDAVADQD